jgi:hypothetical protein
MYSDDYYYLLGGFKSRYPLIGQALCYHQSTRGDPMTFRDKPYLVELYQAMLSTDTICIRKAVQTGVSELLIQMSLHFAGWQGKIVAYTLPVYKIRDRFVQARIDPLLISVPEYRDRSPSGSKMDGISKKAAENLKMKRFGRGWLHFLSSNTPGDFVEFSADIMVVDEYDQCDPANLAKAYDRLRESTHAQMYYVGNPSRPGIGVSRLFDESDGRRWHYRCPHCRHVQYLDWFESVVRRREDGKWVPRDTERAHGSEKDIRPVCRGCARPFNRASTWYRWLPTNPTHDDEGVARPVGYSMSRLDVLSDSLRDLLKEWLKAQGDTAKLAAFFNSVLGVPYEAAGARVSDSMLTLASSGEALDYSAGANAYGKRLVTAGIDVGSVLNVSISVFEAPKKEETEGEEEEEEDLDLDVEPIRRAVWVGALGGKDAFEKAADLLRRYKVDFCVVDSAPETRKAQELRDTFAGTGCSVWLCRFFPTPRIGRVRYGMNLDHSTQVVTVDRTQLLDATFDDIRDLCRIFPEDINTVLGWAQQMKAPARILDETRNRIIWSEGNKADHYRFADAYDRVAYDLHTMGGGYFVV